MNWIGPTGGVFYHYLAWKYGRKLWTPFRSSLAQWLSQWNPEVKNLVLIGPSGGYCIPHEFIERFSHVHVIDPDPLAREIFRRRHRGKARLSFSSRDFLNQETLSELQILFADMGCAILFCNVLGQLPLKAPFKSQNQKHFEHLLEKLETTLEGIPWASFHDRISGPVQPVFQEESPTRSRSLTNDEIVENFYTPAPPQKEGLCDHLTGVFAKDKARTYFSWQILPTRSHLIEGVIG